LARLAGAGAFDHALEKLKPGPSRLRWLAAGALVAGTLDISYAILFYYFRNGAPPERILQSVATGLLGKAAFQGGAASAALGLGLHFFVATTITLVFCFAARRLDVLTRHPFVSGALYGIGVYGVMNYVVIPLSRIGHLLPFVPLVAITGILVHMFCIGIPIAWSVKKALGRPDHSER
jgi:hypothetical protein